MLDEEHTRLQKKDHDVNDYTLGRIGVHNVAIACLPAGLLGNSPAATVARDMVRNSIFQHLHTPSLQLAYLTQCNPAVRRG